MVNEGATPPERKRILALDGGGVRGVFTIEVLARMETLLRVNMNKPKLVLADHFDFIAGTSTGAIIATLLSLGETVENVRTLYRERCRDIFPSSAPWRIWRARRILRRFARAIYGEEPLIKFLKEYFTDKRTNEDTLLGSDLLKTRLLLCMRNSTTGSAWPITNNPLAHYNQRDRQDCNLDLPLWKLVRASTAAPIYFLPELIDIGHWHFAFIDGGMTSYNNPALIAYLTATQPCYNMNWPTGVDKLHLVSIGTGRTRNVLKDMSIRALNFLKSLENISAGLMENINVHQDFMCRVMGSCLFGDQIDREVGTLVEEITNTVSNKKFSYVRYDHEFVDKELVDVVKKLGPMVLNNIRTMPYLTKLGEDYAHAHVKIEHLL